MQGATGVVVNAPTKTEVVEEICKEVDIPVVATIANFNTDYIDKIRVGAKIINVSAAASIWAAVTGIE